MIHLEQPIFKDIDLSEEWLYVLEHGETKFYDNGTAVVNIYIDPNNVMVISTWAKDHKNFSKGMIRDIIKAGRFHEKGMIHSTKKQILKHMEEVYGFSYNKENEVYLKNVDYYDKIN